MGPLSRTSQHPPPIHRAPPLGALAASAVSACLILLLVFAPQIGLGRASAPLDPPPLPLSKQGPRLAISGSARVELWQIAASLTRGGAISLNTAARADAFKHVGRVAGHPAVALLRDVGRLRLTHEDQLGFILAHSELPRLSPGRAVDRWVSPEFAAAMSPRERAKILEKLTDELKDFYRVAELEGYFETRSAQYQTLVQALASALPGDEPLDDLDARLGGRGPAVLILPSLIAEQPRSVTLPATEDSYETQVLLLPLPEGALPQAEVLRGALRFEAVALARLQPMLAAFQGELEQAARALNDAASQGKSGGITLDLTQGGLVTAETLTQALLRSLFLRFIEGDGAWVLAAQRDADARKLPQVAAMETQLAKLEAQPSRYPTLYTQLPLVLEAAILSEEVVRRPPLPPGDFERWEAGSPVGWTVSASSAPRPDDRPSQVERLPAGKDNPNAALRLVVPADATQWKEVISAAIPVSPGDRVTIRAKIRSQDVRQVGTELVGAHIFAVLHGRGDALVSRVQGRTLTGSQPWQESAITLEIPSSTATLAVGLSLGMPGLADFDDVRVEILHPEDQRLLHHGGFEVAGAEAPEGWSRVLGAQNPVNGPSIDSVWSLDEAFPAQGARSLQLRGVAQTSRWFGVQSPNIRTKPGLKVTFSGQVKTQDVVRDGRQERNANLFLEFVNERGALVGRHTGPVIMGTTPWTTQTLEATAPMDAVWVRVGCTLSLSGTLWVDDVHLSQR